MGAAGMGAFAPSETALPTANAGDLRARRLLWGLGAGLLAMALLALALGPVAIPLHQVPMLLLSAAGFGVSVDAPPYYEAVLMSIRLPRMLLGVAVGATLALAGAVLQGLFRNPLADPGLVGVSAGGALAAVAVIVLGGTALSGIAGALPAAAFFGSLGATATVMMVARVRGRIIVATMLLAGIAVNALAGAGIGFFTFLSTDEELRTLTFWTLGSLASATWSSTLPALALMALACIGMMRLSRPLNCYLLGEREAGHLGVDIAALKRQAVAFVALGVGAAVAVSGTIGFVGLVVPHLVRLMAGPDHRFVLPGSILLGAALILAADLIARLVVVPAELPIGLVTSILGAPFFLWLLMRQSRKAAF